MVPEAPTVTQGLGRRATGGGGRTAVTEGGGGDRGGSVKA
jgi:hypothetical protein